MLTLQKNTSVFCKVNLMKRNQLHPVGSLKSVSNFPVNGVVKM